jgi:hypothetical protein
MKIFIPEKGVVYRLQKDVMIPGSRILQLSKPVLIPSANGPVVFLPQGILMTIWIRITSAQSWKSDCTKIFLKSCKDNVEDLRGVNFYLNNELLSELDLEPV